MELIVKAKDIFLEYAGRDILDIEELEIYSYDRIGLVGDNGAGKTSLLKILSGNLTIADADVRRFGSIALIGQLDELDLDAAQGSGEMLSRLNVAGVAQETMSGGEETRAKIASALSQQASAIFADEPTSHLDQDGISLLVGQLKAFDGALLIVSHDRNLDYLRGQRSQLRQDFHHIFRCFLEIVVTQNEIWEVQHFLKNILVAIVFKINIVWLIELRHFLD